MPQDTDIQSHIRDLVATEKDLRDRLARGEITRDEEHEELRRAEVELDQCWDLLRQRQALREFGGNADQATVRSAGTVEGYES